LADANVVAQKLRCYKWFMNIERVAPGALSDAELLVELTRLAAVERGATVRLIAALAELDARRLYLGEGYSSLFAYCTRVLRLAEGAAYNRIEVARASRRFPVLLTMLERGDLTLTTVRLLAPHLNERNCVDVLLRAKHHCKREVEEIVASLRPKPDAPTVLRKLPDREPHLLENLNAPFTRCETAALLPTDVLPKLPAPAVVQPLAPDRYKLQLTVSRSTQEKLRRAQDLMRHSVPSGDLAMLLDRALDLLLEDIQRKKMASTLHPRGQRARRRESRYIPSAVRRHVWNRDQGRCAFNGARGRCTETTFLEFHHVRPFAENGEATAENIQLRCRAHNQYEATLYFGNEFVVREEVPLLRRLQPVLERAEWA
jgi:hypothetical protein